MSDYALLIIDLVNDFLGRLPEQDCLRLIENTNQVIAQSREAGLPVIWVRQEFEPDLSDAFLEMKRNDIAITIKGTPGAEISSELDRRADDPVVIKKRYSAFFQTDLEGVLGSIGAEKLIICGINTHACVRMAAIDAYQRDYQVVVAADCVGTYDHEHGDVTLRYLEGKIAQVLSNADICALLARG